jgi:cysteine synthase A
MSDEEQEIAATTPRFRFDAQPAHSPQAAAPARPPEDAVAHVEEVIADPDQPVVLFALEWCEFCWSVRKLFAAAGIPFRSVDLDGPDYRENDWGGAVRKALAAKTGAVTIPQIFVGGRHIGGATETFDVFNSGELKRLLGKLGLDVKDAEIGNAYGFLPAWLHPRKPAAAA